MMACIDNLHANSRFSSSGEPISMLSTHIKSIHCKLGLNAFEVSSIHNSPAGLRFRANRHTKALEAHNDLRR